MASRWPFATRAEEPGARRATDLILGVGALASLVAVGSVAVPRSGIERAVLTFVRAVPDALGGLWQLLLGLLLGVAAGLVVATVARRRWAVLRDLALGAAVALGLAAGLRDLVSASWASWWGSLDTAGSAPWLPMMRLAVPTALRDRAADHLGIEAPQLEKLRRVSWRSTIQVALLVVAFLVLAAAVGGLDLDQLRGQLADAVWWLIVAGFLVAQATRLAQAVSTMGASPDRCRCGSSTCSSWPSRTWVWPCRRARRASRSTSGSSNDRA